MVGSKWKKWLAAGLLGLTAAGFFGRLRDTAGGAGKNEGGNCSNCAASCPG